MAVIDAHAHLGFDVVFQHDFREAELTAELNSMGVDSLILQPATVFDLASAREQHDEVARFASANSGRVFGMANPCPHLPDDLYREEVKRCVRELGFVGVKLNTNAHSVGVGLAPGRRVFSVASDLGLPVMIHTGLGVPWALPSAVQPLAREYNDLRIVLAHSGGMMFASEALEVARLYPNVYLEVSWLPAHVIAHFCREIGAQRVLWGADHAENAPVQLKAIDMAGLTPADLEWVLGGTATEVYRLPV
jgi:hypothetical protein